MYNFLNYKWYLNKIQIDKKEDNVDHVIEKDCQEKEFMEIDKAIEELNDTSDSNTEFCPKEENLIDAIQSYKMNVKSLREELTIIYSELDISRSSYEKLLLLELVDQLIKLVPKNYDSQIIFRIRDIYLILIYLFRIQN